MNKLQRIRIESGALDVAGEATVLSFPVRGRVRSVQIDYPANVCDVDITTDELVSQSILSLSSANTDTVLYPRTPVCNNSGAENVTYDGTNKVHDCFDVFGRISLAITNGTAADEVVIHVLVEEY